MVHEESVNVSAGSLSDLFSLDGHLAEWRREEYAEILEHQLSVPLPNCVNRCGQKERMREEASDWAGAIETFRDLLQHPDPPVNFAERVKVFARHARMSHGGPLPDEVAAVLYYSCIVTAFINHGEWITSLSHETVEKGLGNLLAREWIQGEIRVLLSDGMDTMAELNR